MLTTLWTPTTTTLTTLTTPTDDDDDDDAEESVVLGPIEIFGENLVRTEAPLQVVVTYPPSPQMTQFNEDMGCVQTFAWVNQGGSVVSDVIDLGRPGEFNVLEIQLLNRNLTPVTFTKCYRVKATFKLE